MITMTTKHVLWVAAITLACAWVGSAYTPVWTSVASVESQIATVERTHPKEVSHVFLREKRPGFEVDVTDSLFDGLELLDTGPSASTDDEASIEAIVYEDEILAMYGVEVSSEDLPALAISDYMSYGQNTMGIYYNEWVYSVLLVNGTLLQYGSNGVFLTITQLFDGNATFVRSDIVAPFVELLDTGGPEDEVIEIDLSDLFGEQVLLSSLPTLAIVDIAWYSSSFDSAYYDADWGQYVVFLEDGTILEYGRNGVFLTIEA